MLSLGGLIVNVARRFVRVVGDGTGYTAGEEGRSTAARVSFHECCPFDLRELSTITDRQGSRVNLVIATSH